MEKRRFDRVSLRTQPYVLDGNLECGFAKDLVISKNVSASGLCFRSSKGYQQGQRFLVYLHDDVLHDLQLNRARVIKSGNYFLAQSIWCHPSPSQADPFFEVGCSFVKLTDGSFAVINHFTSLVNYYVAQQMKLVSLSQTSS